jgi:hypothetical protein
MAETHDMTAKTGPQHESLARFSGAWRAEVKLYLAPGQGPQVSHGKMLNTLELGGLFLRQHYRDDSGMFEGHGYWGYNTTDGRYEGFWIDPMCSFFQLEHGQHDARSDAYEMRGSMTCPSTRQPMKKRSVIAYKSANEHTMEQWIETTPGQEMKTMEIRYTRTGA